MTLRTGLGLAIALSLGVVLATSPIAEAFIPSASRILLAIAAANVDGKRTSALQFDVTMRIGEGPPVAHGELLSWPSGGSRLELRGTNQTVERHLQRGFQYMASRNGSRISKPRLLLPPLSVLQASSKRKLDATLASLGIDPAAVALGACGEDDCFVLGDVSRVAPSLEEPTDTGEERVEMPPSTPVRPEVDRQMPPPTLWVDTESFDTRRLRTRRNVRVEFGGYRDFGVVRAPSWLRVDEPGRESVRFDVQKVLKVVVPESEMDMDWLSGPAPLPSATGNPADGFEATPPR